MVEEKMILFVFFARKLAMTVLQVPRLPCPQLSLVLCISENERTSLCP